MRRTALIASCAVAVACLVGFWELAEDFAFSLAILALDQRVGGWIVSLRTPMLTTVMRAVTFTGGTLFVVILTTGIVVALLARRLRDRAVFAAVVVAVGALLSAIAKGQFGRVRPPAATALVALPGSYSFPSGHAMASLCLAVVVGFLTLKSPLRPAAKTTVLVACAVYAIAVGFSRVYLGVHYPSDVLASWLLGGSWVAVAVGAAAGLTRS